MITIVSLGTERGDLSLRGAEAIQRADKVLLRTELLPSAESVRRLGVQFQTLDNLYERSRNWDTFTEKALREIKRAAKNCNLCYCVDGGVSEDRVAGLLIADGVAEVIEGVTKGAKAAAAAGLACAYQSASAYEIYGALTLPLVVYDITDKNLAGDVKLVLIERFGAEAPACFLTNGKPKKIALYEMDRQASYGEQTAVVVYDAPLLERKRFGLDDLMEILRRLRAPDGCPWDRVQTHQSIRINAIEEAYELVDAIDCDDPDKMCEEAGDVFMQAAFHTLMEEERGNFTLTDVLSGVCEKLITRHTHVFGADKAAGADGALSVWDKNKMAEKHQTTFSDSVNDVPYCFPALLRAQKIAKRTGKGGWDLKDLGALEEKLGAEIEALKAAHAAGGEEELARALGRVLMCAVWLGRAVGADCEQALLDEAKRMQARYTAFEKLVTADGKDVTALTDEEKRAYYQRAAQC